MQEGLLCCKGWYGLYCSKHIVHIWGFEHYDCLRLFYSPLSSRLLSQILRQFRQFRTRLEPFRLLLSAPHISSRHLWARQSIDPHPNLWGYIAQAGHLRSAIHTPHMSHAKMNKHSVSPFPQACSFSKPSR